MAAADHWAAQHTSPGSPGRRFVAVTPNDGVELSVVTKALLVGTAGDVAVVGADDSGAVTIPNMQPGIWHPMQVKQVLATGTEPAEIVAMYDNVK